MNTDFALLTCRDARRFHQGYSRAWLKVAFDVEQTIIDQLTRIDHG
jgi:hypothetical protein